MKINKMPTAIGLLFFSWLFAIFGLAGCAYLIFFKFTGINSLIKGFSFLFGALFLAIIIRMLANIGQLIFDLKADSQKLSTSLPLALQTLAQKLTTLDQDLKSQFYEQNAVITENLQSQVVAILENLQALENKLERLQAISDKLEYLQAIRDKLEHPQAISDKLEYLQAIRDKLERLQAISDKLEYLQAIRDRLEYLQTIRDKLERVDCDSKDINQNIHQIKTFFEQIEKHLDLKIR